MANKYPLPYAFARSHQLLLEDDGTRLTLWLCPDSVANAISEVMRKWGNDNAGLDIARDDTSSLKQRISQAYTTQYGPGESSAAAVVSEVESEADLSRMMQELPAVEDLLETSDDAPIIRMLNADVRVSTLPSAHGERAVLRLLDKSETRLSLASVGMQGRTLERFQQLVTQPHGLILVTGPTGSGKTTTLYAALQSLDAASSNIMTVEDPIEYELAGVGQTQVNAKIDLTFAKALRAILRQDPDVIMIGEIRDFETAQIAIQASMTGHLVLATLHTNDAASAVTRL
ncbi:MAG: AAA family ATPase, partial [Betaproteobacteria bacterium]|nr:AAA family ATPase [Betaproteobacteria bacterium]